MAMKGNGLLLYIVASLPKVRGSLGYILETLKASSSAVAYEDMPFPCSFLKDTSRIVSTIMPYAPNPIPGCSFQEICMGCYSTKPCLP
jgi:hypothetical protein